MEPELLYHYTDHNGLIGIIKNWELWHTHIAYLNDASEYGFAEALMNDALRAIKNNSEEDLPKIQRDVHAHGQSSNSKNSRRSRAKHESRGDVRPHACKWLWPT